MNLNIIIPFIFLGIFVFCIIRDIIHPVKEDKVPKTIKTKEEKKQEVKNTIKAIILFPFRLIADFVMTASCLLITCGIPILLLSAIQSGAGYLLSIVDNSLLYVLILVTATALVIIVCYMFRRRH